MDSRRTSQQHEAQAGGNLLDSRLTALTSDLHEGGRGVADDAEARGLFFEWAAIGDMDVDDVISGSPLHQALMGHPPDR